MIFYIFSFCSHIYAGLLNQAMPHQYRHLYMLSFPSLLVMQEKHAHEQICVKMEVKGLL